MWRVIASANSRIRLAVGRRVVDRHSKVMFFEEQGERVLIAMIAAPLVAHPDGLIERHLAQSGYPPEDL